MATIEFRADDNGITNLNGSGLGFFGASFGSSVDVGSYQTTTFITNDDGTIEGEQVHNIQWKHSASGSINGAAPVNVLQIPNQLATLNIRFTHSTAVKTQNASVRIYDRSSINNDPSGVLAKLIEIRHPDTVQNSNGSGSAAWQTIAGSGSTLSLVASPGSGGQRPSGVDTKDDRHDWYLGITCSPNSVGSKTFALYMETEYL